jgi:hypothetical protein
MMHWIIQSNLVGAEDVQRLREALLRLDTPFTNVRLVPIICELEEIPKIEGPAFVYGSTFVHRAAYAHGWWPGYIGGKADYEDVLRGYGDQMLNSDISYVALRDLKIDGPMFVRPEDDGKLFTGAVLYPEQVAQLLEKVSRENASRPEDCLGSRVVVSSPKKILAEHRCLVVNGRVVSASTYRRGPRIVSDGRVDEAVLSYAQEQVDRYNPDIGFAIDIAQTSEGMKIIEINALSSSGFYACDLMPFIDAINRLDDLAPRPSSRLPTV